MRLWTPIRNVTRHRRRMVALFRVFQACTVERLGEKNADSRSSKTVTQLPPSERTKQWRCQRCSATPALQRVQTGHFAARAPRFMPKAGVHENDHTDSCFPLRGIHAFPFGASAPAQVSIRLTRGSASCRLKRVSARCGLLWVRCLLGGARKTIGARSVNQATVSSNAYSIQTLLGVFRR